MKALWVTETLSKKGSRADGRHLLLLLLLFPLSAAQSIHPSINEATPWGRKEIPASAYIEAAVVIVDANLGMRGNPFGDGGDDDDDDDNDGDGKGLPANNEAAKENEPGM